MAGFGIRTPEQVETLRPYCDAAIAGSFIVNRVTEAAAESAGTGVLRAASEAVKYLLGQTQP